MRKLLGRCVAGLLCLPLSSYAAQPLTWMDCVKKAAENNPDLRAAVRAQEASRATYYGSYNGILPQLDLTHSYSDRSGLGSGRSRLWQAEGTASLNVIDFNEWASIRSAAASWRQTQANVRVASSTVLLNLYRAFASLLYAQQEIGVATNIRDLWKTNAQMIDLRYDSGRESKGNALRTQAESLQADMALKQAGRDVQIAKRQLAQALGQENYTSLEVTGSFAGRGGLQESPNMESILDELPAIQAQKAAVDKTKANVSAAKSSLFPTLSLSYSRGFSDTSEFPTTNPSWTFTGLLRYPLFGGGPTQTYYSTVSANRLYEKSLLDLRSLRDQTLTSLENAWSSFVQAQDQVQVQEAFLKSAVQRKQEADTLYQAGLMSFQDWQVITTDYVNFQKSHLAAQQTLLAAEGQWRFTSGEQLGEER